MDEDENYPRSEGRAPEGFLGPRQIPRAHLSPAVLGNAGPPPTHTLPGHGPCPGVKFSSKTIRELRSEIGIAGSNYKHHGLQRKEIGSVPALPPPASGLQSGVHSPPTQR